MAFRPSFHLESRTAPGTRARAGRLLTAHGEALTPLFMPVGTQATVRGLKVEELEELGAKVLLANTYHLLLRPGPEVFERFGGIHRFMGWNGAVLTDSGGFQIFSLPGSRSLGDDGALFKSYVDGKMVLLSPETSIGMQLSIGSDIMMVLDECVPSTVERKIAEQALARTNKWALRSLTTRGDRDGGLFAIVQGACFEDLRRESAAFLTELPFDGFAIGGLAVGETKAEREDFTELTAGLLPVNKPRYLMGVGTPIDLLEAVHRGVDMFDCIIPGAHAQHGMAFSMSGAVRLRRSAYRLQDVPIAADCSCYTCMKYSRGYLHHLVKTNEGLGWRLIAQHNLHFYQVLMRDLRTHILSGTFPSRYRDLQGALVESDGDPPTPRKPEKRPLTLGRYAVRISPTGAAHIVQDSGEAMHPAEHPDLEAEQLYVERSELKKRLKAHQSEPLVIWDVGLGAGHNAMAAVRAIESAVEPGSSERPVHMVSFENDLDSLILARRHIGRFPHLRHPGPAGILGGGTFQSRVYPLTWTLLKGDFLERMADAPNPDLIFFDPFSYKTDAPLWHLSTFKQILAKVRDLDVELFTYSTSTAVRSSMLAAGFFVARAPGVSPRKECTVALTAKAWKRVLASDGGLEVLSDEWLRRWERSDARMPLGASGVDTAALETLIRDHRQFAGRGSPTAGTLT